MDDITLTVRGERRITIEYEAPIKISIEPLPSEVRDTPILRFPPPCGSSSSNTADYEFNPR